jgi:predicted Zn-dependent peptidase
MSVDVSVLESGLSVVSHHMPQVETVALGVWTQAGSRDETPNQNGLAHLLEHMAFKGTPTRSAFDIAAQIEAAGGDMNASTSMEKTAYYARVLKDDWLLALDVISDIVMQPKFEADDLALEKSVILQEIAAAKDTPDDLVFDLAQAAAWPNHPLGRDILGTPETVSQFACEDLTAYRQRHYTAGRMVVSAAGNLDHDQLVDAASKALSGVRAGPQPDRQPPGFTSARTLVKRPLDQVHQVLAFPAVGYHDKDIYAAYLTASILGGGMSSRLFQEARERRGLCYSTFAYVSAYADAGLMQIYAATAHDKAAEFAAVAADIAHSLEQSVTAEELERARAQVKASLVMSLESPSSRADQIARQYLSYGRVPEVSDILSRIDAVERCDISRIARSIFHGNGVSHAAVGATSLLAKTADIAAHFG